MNSYARVKQLYLEVFALTSQERVAYLEKKANGDEELVRSVLELFEYEADTRVPSDVASSGIATLNERHHDSALDTLPDEIGGYRILRLIGQGAMGVVYEAEQHSPKRRVALKILRRRMADPIASRRFELEAEIQGRLDHIGIARIIEARIDDDVTLPFLAMEFVDGKELREYIREANPSQDAKLLLIQQLCEAAHYAHGHGVIHRDLKPGNILVDKTGAAKILDFGIARLHDSSEDKERTLDGEIVGTLSYMSPEQASGRANEVDLQSDVYALGVIAYQILAGHLPRDLSGKALPHALAIIQSEPATPLSRWLPDIPKDVETIVHTALSTDRENRYPTAAALANDIAHYLNHEPIRAHPGSALHHLMLFARRQRALVLGTGAVFVALLIGLLATLQFAYRANESADKERAQKLRAEQAVTTAVNAQRNEEQASYEARITAASAALEAGRSDEAEALLEDTAAELRGFEWHHLKSKLDTAALVRGPDQDTVGDVCFGPNGTILIGKSSGIIEFIDTETHALIDRITVEPGLMQFDLSRSGQFLYTVHGDGSIFSYDLESSDQIRSTVREHSDDQPKIRAHPTLRKLLVSSKSGRHIWDPLQTTAASIRKAKRGRGGAWAPDGKRLAVDPMMLVDGTSGHSLGTTFETSEIPACLAWSPDGAELAVGTEHPGIHLINIASERRRLYVRGAGNVVSAIAYSPSEKWLVYGSDEGNVEVIRSGDGEHIAYLLGHDEEIVRIAFSPDGKYVAAATENWVRVWNSNAAARQLIGHGHTSYVYHIAFSPNGKYLASFAWDSTVRLWCGESGRSLGIVAEGLRPPMGLAWAQDGKSIFADQFARVRISVAPGSQPVANKLGRQLEVNEVAYPGRLRLRTNANDGTEAFLWPSNKRRLLIQRPNGSPLIAIDLPAAIRAFALDPQGNSCAIACRGRAPQIIDVDSQEVIHEIDTPERKTHALAFSSDGRRLAVGGQRSTIRLFDTKTSDLVAVLHGHRGEIRALCFSNDGTRLASGSSDQSIRVWSTRSAAEAQQHAVPLDTFPAQPERQAVTSSRRQFEHTPRSEFGAAIAIGDIDGDGHAEVIVGAPGTPPLQTGSVHVIDPRTGKTLQSFKGPHAGAMFGTSVAVIDDLDGDGRRDLAVGAPGFDSEAGEDVGAAVFLSTKGGQVIRTHLGERPHQRLGRDLLATADADGDNVRDVISQDHRKRENAHARIISSRTAKTISEWQLGKVQQGLFRVPNHVDHQQEAYALAYSDHLRLLSAKDWRELARVDIPTGRRWARTLSPIEDLDGDGLPEFIVGHQSAHAKPMLRVYCLTSSGDESWSTELPRHSGSPRLHALPDLDGDGCSDVAVAVGPRGSVATVGFRSLHILSGLTGKTLKVIEYTGRLTSQSVRVLDIDKDGVPEVLLGLPSHAKVQAISLDNAR